MTTYMLLIEYDPTVPAGEGPSRQPEHARLAEAMRERGHYVSGAGLAPTSMYSRRVRRDGGNPVVLDGPFAETKEALGGYFVVECSEDEAMDYAARIPVDERSWVEVRRVGIYQA